MDKKKAVDKQGLKFTYCCASCKHGSWIDRTIGFFLWLSLLMILQYIPTKFVTCMRKIPKKER